MSNRQLLEAGKKILSLCPLKNAFWYPNLTYTRFHFYYQAMSILFLAIPANLIDLGAKVLGIKLP